jgi:Tol biopolymer transport system component
LDSAGNQDNSYDTDPSISADGRYVAFWSNASNLVAEDTNGRTDVFVHDRHEAVTKRVSIDSAGGQIDSGGMYPSISADGRFVAFLSSASDLVVGDTNDSPDIFVHDSQTGTTERVSVATDSTEANYGNFHPSISADGCYVAFTSQADNLVAGDVNGGASNNFEGADIFVHDCITGQTKRVSSSGDGTSANSSSDLPSISADGRHIAFRSSANNIVEDDTNDTNDIFVHDWRASSYPVIVLNLTDITLTNGESFNLTVVAGSTNSYQWYKDGVSLPGETGAILTRTNVTVNDAGEYYVELTNENGDTLSSLATVTVN